MTIVGRPQDRRRLAIIVPLLAALAGCEPENLLDGLPDAAVAVADAAGCPSAHILFMHHGPATYYPGSGPSDSVANRSPLITEEVLVAEPEPDESDWLQLMACVRARLEPYNLEVTDVDPGNVDHLEIYVGREPTMLGLAPGTASVAVPNCGTPNPRDIGFAFHQADGSLTCEDGVAWVLGPMHGLQHTIRCEDIMSGLGGHTCAGERSFLDDDVACSAPGSDQPAACSCGGTLQNSHRALLDTYGPRCQ